MTPIDDAFWRRATGRINGLQSDMAAAVLRAFRVIRASLDDEQLARFIASGGVERLLAEAFSEAALNRAALPVRSRLRQTTQDAFRYATADLPKGGKINGVVAVQFDSLSPDVVTALRDLDDSILPTFAGDTRDAITAWVENGLRDGDGPTTIARTIRQIVGLAPNQVTAVANFRRALSGDSSASPFDYALRDKRFDARVKAGGLTESQIDNMTAAYARKMQAFHAETVARTATLQSYKAGQDLAWKNAIDSGVVEPGSLKKRWVGVMDDRERPEHVAMEGETVDFDASYSNGEQIPGESTWNCRCVSRVFVSRAA